MDIDDAPFSVESPGDESDVTQNIRQKSLSAQVLVRGINGGWRFGGRGAGGSECGCFGGSLQRAENRAFQMFLVERGEFKAFGCACLFGGGFKFGVGAVRQEDDWQAGTLSPKLAEKVGRRLIARRAGDQSDLVLATMDRLKGFRTGSGQTDIKSGLGSAGQ